MTLIDIGVFRKAYFDGFTDGYNRRDMCFESSSAAYCKAYLDGHQQGGAFRTIDESMMQVAITYLGGDVLQSEVAERLLNLRAGLATLRERSALQGRKGEITDEEGNSLEEKEK